MTRLDTREARTDLTSRECGKLLCGLVYPTTHLFGEDVMRTVLDFLADENTLWKVFKTHRKTKPPPARLIKKLVDRRCAALPGKPHQNCELVMGGIVGAMTTMADLDDVRTAVKWTRDHLDQLMHPTAEMLKASDSILSSVLLQNFAEQP